jgi:hypothetical protein
MITRQVLSNPFNNNNNLNTTGSVNNKRKRNIIQYDTVIRIILFGSIIIVIVALVIITIVQEKQQQLQNVNDKIQQQHQQLETNKDIPTKQKQQQQLQQQHTPLVVPNSKGTIAYATVLTDCSKGLKINIPFQILESAAVLTYSIQQNSIRSSNNSTKKSQYDYKFYLIYHPQAKVCANEFEQFGFILLERSFPVVIEQMKSQLLRNKIQSNGCCGERELIKLEVYTLINHPLVVLFDLDVLLLKPFDILFDYMLYNIPLPNDHMLYPIKEQHKIGSQIDILYTVDYGMANYPDKPVQGGFVIIRPNQTVYNDYVQIVQDGDFRDDGGWGGKSGRFWGAMTFQGLTPYYWISLHPHRSIELNWCYYDNMNTASIKDKNSNLCTVPDIYPCSDCSKMTKNDVYLFHYTVCQKPWTCQIHDLDRLCTEMHHEWFTVRSQLEQSWGRSGTGIGQYHTEQFNGYCTGSGHNHYIPIKQPFFQP